MSRPPHQGPGDRHGAESFYTPSHRSLELLHSLLLSLYGMVSPEGRGSVRSGREYLNASAVWARFVGHACRFPRLISFSSFLFLRLYPSSFSSCFPPSFSSSFSLLFFPSLFPSSLSLLFSPLFLCSSSVLPTFSSPFSCSFWSLFSLCFVSLPSPFSFLFLSYALFLLTSCSSCPPHPPFLSLLSVPCWSRSRQMGNPWSMMGRSYRKTRHVSQCCGWEEGQWRIPTPLLHRRLKPCNRLTYCFQMQHESLRASS